jgi:hypothetical protein
MRVSAVRAAEDLAVALSDCGPLRDQDTAVSALFVGHRLHLRANRCTGNATEQKRHPEADAA